MKNLHLLKFMLLICLGFFAQLATAQTEADSTQLWRIVTTDGNAYIGAIESRNSEQIVLRTETIGLITIQVRNVKSMEEVNPQRMVAGELWADNPQATRYFWGPNGYGLRQGEGYYQNVWVLFNQVSVGITDNISIGVGLVPLFLFDGTATPVWITPKISIPVKKDAFNVGAGVLAGTILGENEGGFGIAYGVTTFGNRDKNLTLGLGYGFADGEWASQPAITISGMLRVGKKGYLLTENYIIEDVVLITLGGRTVWSGVSLDYGLILPISGDGFIGIPWLGLVVPFGKKQRS